MGRFVKRGEKGIQILAPMIGHRRRKDAADEEQSAGRDARPAPVLIGFRAVYVFDRLSRDLCPARVRHVSRAAPVYCATAATTSSLRSGMFCKYDDSVFPEGLAERMLTNQLPVSGGKR